MKYYLQQYKWYRKWKKGSYYYILVTGLTMAPFWSDYIIKNCGSMVLREEHYE